MTEYTPHNWYWFVGGDETRAYSTATAGFVLVSNAAFQAWLAAGGVPTRIATAEELGEVLAPYQFRPINTATLDSYKSTLADEIVLKAIGKLLFNYENRIRAIERALSLNGSPPNVTPAQAKTFIKGLM